MLLSRFWYVFLGLFAGALVFLLFLAQSVHNRAVGRSLQEGLVGDSQVVSWYLKNDARERASQLIKFAVNNDLGRGLAEASRAEGDVPEKARKAVKDALTKVSSGIAKSENFDAMFAVDQSGRVIAQIGYDQALGVSDFELGGYSVVADALHGYIRDDTLLLDRPYRVVARPVEYDLGQLPAGAVVGARVLDERFARELSERTGAAVAFFVRGDRIAAAVTDDFDKLLLDQVSGQLTTLKDEQFSKTGLSAVQLLRGTPLGVVYSRIPGETWQLDVGYVVARQANEMSSVVSFFKQADDKDKQSVPLSLVLLIALAAMGVGLGFSFLEHTLPLKIFGQEAQRLAKGEIQQLQISRFRSALRRIASDLNDGIEHAVAQGGGSRRAADLKQVIGDIPDQPQMSAFSLPVSSAPEASTEPPASIQMPPDSSFGTPAPPSVGGRPPPPPRHRNNNADATLQTPQAPPEPDGDEEPEWYSVFAEFVRTKQSCGEPTDGVTFEKFKQTLRKNRDALTQRHGVSRVKFSVYVKEGRAALKASPIRE